MKTRTKLPVLFLALALLAALLPASLQADANEPQVIAVKLHADWCGSCKKMGTAFEDLSNKFDGKPVLFVTLDRTNNTTRHQSDLLASAIGAGKIAADNPGTGYVLLLDGKSRKVLGKLTADLSVKEMGKKLQGVLDA